MKSPWRDTSMQKLFAKWRREEGVTLIELIAVLSIMGLVLGIISTTIFFGFRSYNRISVENNLRDQGDVIMSSIITELYRFAPDRIYPLTDAKTNRVYGLRLVNEDATGQPDLAGADEIIISRDDQGRGQLEIHKAEGKGTTADASSSEPSAAPADPYESTRIQGGHLVVSDANTQSSILLEGDDLNVFGYLKTGLVNIKLVLQMDDGTDSSEITLDSRFGF
ncbi:hypothetical protein B9G55_10225 [Saccharibacillus sp. O16]|nr:hypothetical protein B9G55_10225 [Saccharibacillus sp. O16]